MKHKRLTLRLAAIVALGVGLAVQTFASRASVGSTN